MPEIASTCCYCGVGCGVLISRRDGRITGVRGDPHHPANFGKLCSKGSTLHLTATETVTRQARLLQPMQRLQRGAAPQPVGWDDALRLAASRLGDIVQRHGPDAVGFYLSGHLFDEVCTEVRKFARRRIDELIDSREPQLLAGIVGDLRMVNGQRGRVAIFKLDDKTEAIEAVASEDLVNANRELMKDDELVIVQGKVQNDRFSGGLRLNINQIWDLAGARARFGRYLSLAVNGGMPADFKLQDHGLTQLKVARRGGAVFASFGDRRFAIVQQLAQAPQRLLQRPGLPPQAQRHGSAQGRKVKAAPPSAAASCRALSCCWRLRRQGGSGAQPLQPRGPQSARRTTPWPCSGPKQGRPLCSRACRPR